MYSNLLKPHLQYLSQFWAHPWRNLSSLDCVQKMVMKVMKNLQTLPDQAEMVYQGGERQSLNKICFYQLNWNIIYVH